MTDTVIAPNTATQANQLGDELLTELEDAVAAQTAADTAEPDAALTTQLRKLEDDTKSAFNQIVQEYKSKRQALVDQAKAAQIEALKQQLAA